MGLENRIRIYAGQYYDAETGLHYNYHRYYDPATGRYLTADPIGLAGGINLFAYVSGNPANLVDPLGLSPSFDQNNDGVRDEGCGEYDNLNFDLSYDFSPLDFHELLLMAIFPEVMVPVIIGVEASEGIFKAISLKEAKSLMSKWGKGTYQTISDSIRDHATRHGFGNNIPKYLRKAANFNKKGAIKKELGDGAVRWTRKSGEFLIERNGKIVSYGINE